MKFTSTMLAAASGSMGGATASRNRGGQYFRRRAVPVNPATLNQSLVRSAFGTAAQAWTNLTDVQRSNWNNYAAAVPWSDSLGEVIRLSGQQAYIRAKSLCVMGNLSGNTPLSSLDVAALANGPTENTLGPVANDGAAMLGNVGPPVTWDLIASPGEGGGTTTVWAIFMGGPTSPGKSFFKGPYAFVGAATATGGSFQITDFTALSTAWVHRYVEPTAGQLFFGYIRSITPDGRVGSRRPFGPIEAPTPA